MKKIIIFIFILIILVVLAVSLSIFIPSISRTCKIEKYNISMKIPFSYNAVEEEGENILISLYNEQNGISISGVDLKDDFWQSGDTLARIDEYMKVMSSANYDAEIKNISQELIKSTENKIGKIEFELAKINSNNKMIALITNEQIGNVVIEIRGSQESMDKYKKELYKIIDSVKIK